MAGPTVLHVLEATAHGTGRHLLDLVAQVAAEHHIAVPVDPVGRGEHDRRRTERELAGAGATVHRVPLRRSPLHPDLLRGVLAVRRLVATVQPDIVHGHATVGGTVARLAAWRRAPCVYTPNGVHPSRAVRVAERSLRRLAARVVAVSESEAALLRRSGLARPAQLVVIPNGIDLEPPTPADRDLRSDLGILQDAKLVGFVGRLSRQKAPDVLVRAAASLRRDVHVVMIGGGPDRSSVEALVERLGMQDRVHLVGHVDGAARVLGQFDVLALPSRWEGAPYVPLEAFRAGVPVVATAVVGTVDVVEDGVTGRLVPPDDPGALAAAIDHLLTDPTLARRVATAARARLAERFSVAQMAARTGRVYGELTSSSRPTV